MKSRRGLIWLALAAFIAGVSWLVFARPVPPLIREPKLTTMSPAVQSIFDKTKTVCFGRFVMDVPATAEVVYGPAWAPFDIRRLPGEGPHLASHVGARLKEIGEEASLAGAALRAPGSMYGKVLQGNLAGQQIVFGQSAGIFYKIQSFFALGEDLFIQDGEASTHDRPADRDDGRTVAQVVATLNDIADHMHGLPLGDVPSKSGLCIDGAFIGDTAALTHERVTVGIRLAEFPDIHFSVEVNKNQGHLTESNNLETILERSMQEASDQNPAWATRIRMLRKGPRDVNGWKGFEHLIHLPKDGDTADRYHFAFVSLGDATSPLKPNIDVELKSGVVANRSGSVPPSLSEDDAAVVWDRMLGSIRVRPARIAPSANAGDGPKKPLGEIAATGRSCPQTGWWRCVEVNRPVQGGRQQFFRQGDPMPEIVVLGDRNLWQRVSREQPAQRTATVWELVAYAHSPHGTSSGSPSNKGSSGPEEADKDTA